MNIRTAIALAVFTGLAFAPLAAHADDDDDDAPKATRSSQNMPELILGSADSNYAVNKTDFELIAGQGYRWKISSQGGFEYKFMTDLFRNVWVDQIVID